MELYSIEVNGRILSIDERINSVYSVFEASQKLFDITPVWNDGTGEYDFKSDNSVDQGLIDLIVIQIELHEG